MIAKQKRIRPLSMTAPSPHQQDLLQEIALTGQLESKLADLKASNAINRTLLTRLRSECKDVEREWQAIFRQVEAIGGRIVLDESRLKINRDIFQQAEQDIQSYLGREQQDMDSLVTWEKAKVMQLEVDKLQLIQKIMLLDKQVRARAIPRTVKR